MATDSKVDHAEIRAFLEAQGYQIRETVHAEFPFAIANSDLEMMWVYDKSEKDIYKAGLEHFLHDVIGKYWRDIWGDMLGIDVNLSSNVQNNIRLAIRYLEALSEDT